MPYNKNYIVSLELYIIRHGCSGSNAGIEGKTIEEEYDSCLTDKGLRQAELLGERFSKYPLDAVFSSGLNRAVRTASEIVRQQSSDGAEKIEIHPVFTEVGVTEEYPGKTMGELRDRYINAVPAAGTESCERFIEHTRDGKTSKDRARRAVDYLTSRFHNGEKVAVVSHGGFIRYLLEAAMNIDFEVSHTDPSFFNTGVTKIVFFRHGEGIFGNDVVLVYMNDHSHLAREFPEITFEKI